MHIYPEEKTEDPAVFTGRELDPLLKWIDGIKLNGFYQSPGHTEQAKEMLWIKQKMRKNI